MIKILRNDTTSVKAYYNQRNGTFWVLVPGEILEVEIADPAETEDKISSVPPVGKQGITNLYRNPETGRMEIEYQDVPKE